MKYFPRYIICVFCGFCLGMLVMGKIAQHWDIPYSSETKTIERAEDACEKHDSVPETYDWIGNVRCENGISFNIKDW